MSLTVSGRVLNTLPHGLSSGQKETLQDGVERVGKKGLVYGMIVIVADKQMSRKNRKPETRNTP